MNLLFKNGTVINANGRSVSDVAVDGGRIIAVGKNIEPGEQTKIIDASGLLVLPGAVDVHTHFELSFGDAFCSADDFFTGTRAAACGGVTSVIDFVTPEVDEDLVSALRKRREQADNKVCIDYGLHMGIVGVNERTFEEMQAVMALGVRGFKVFTTYAFKLSDKEFRRTLSFAKDLGAVVMVHAEDHEMLEANRAKFIAEGKTDPWYHYLSRPEEVEAKAVKYVIEAAKETGATVYIVHLACAEGLRAVEAAQAEGYPIFAETCPQYLHFTCDVYKRPDARNFVCSPPIKGEESRRVLWEAVTTPALCATPPRRGITASGRGISSLATDHCPFNSIDKDYGKDDFTMIPNGVMGVENFYPYMLSEANKGRLSFERVVELCSYNPARIFGLSAKGEIAPGVDADIVLYDMSKDFIISQKNMHSAVNYTIWEGVNLKGYPIATYSRGNLIFENGVFCGEAGDGGYTAV